VIKYESNLNKPSFKVLIKISDILDVKIDDLIDMKKVINLINIINGGNCDKKRKIKYRCHI